MTNAEIAMQITIAAIEQGLFTKVAHGMSAGSKEIAATTAEGIGEFYKTLLNSISSDEAKDQA